TLRLCHSVFSSQELFMASKVTLFLCGSICALALGFAPALWAQTASEWGKGAIDTGKEAVHATERAFHKVADDPILIERTKSALAHDPITQNQPVIVSANNGVVILQGRVSRVVADRAIRVAQGVEGARGVDNRMLYDGAPIAEDVTPR